MQVTVRNGTPTAAWSYHEQFVWHFCNGTRPGGSRDNQPKQWGREEFVAAVDPGRRLKLDVRLVGYWVEGKLPSKKYAEPIVNAFFGAERRYHDWKRRLQAALTRAREDRGLRLCPRSLPDLPQRIASFTGRETALRRLRAVLRVNSAKPWAVVHGLPGVGKTALANEYVRRYRDRYKGIWWCAAENRSAVLASLAELRTTIGIAGRDEVNLEGMARAAVRRLPKDWLLIYDNAAPGAIDDLLPSERTPLLVTSRFPTWQQFASEVALQCMTEKEAVEFLQRRAKLLDQSGAKVLATVLGRLPLALDHSAAYCRLVGISFRDYASIATKLIDVLPENTIYPRSVATTFELAIDAASGRCPDAERLVAYLAHCAPEQISEALVEGEIANISERAHALIALIGVSLLRPHPLADGTPAWTMHPLVQEVGRARAEKNGHARPATERLIRRLADIYPQDAGRKSTSWALFTHLTPHLLSVLHHLHQREDFWESDNSALLEPLARLVIFALLRAGEDERRGEGHVVPEYLATVLAGFYEVEPLSGGIDILLRRHRDAWPELLDRLLSTDNYVVRYAAAKSLAKAHITRPQLTTVEEIAALLEQNDLNKFELGGVALALIYTSQPKLIESRHLQKVANRNFYPGWRILGDLALNLALQGYDPLKVITDQRFWASIWEFFEIEVAEIEAAATFMAHPRSDSPSFASSRVEESYRNLITIERWREAALDRSAPSECGICKLLAGYFTLGRNVEAIRAAQDELAERPDLEEVIRLLFAHPVWPVREAAATALSSLVELDIRRFGIIASLFEDPNWRVCYGAIEAAFAVRHFDKMTMFSRAVHRFHAHPNCRIRGLCAENLVSIIVNVGGSMRHGLLADFSQEISYWLRDDDCWVLEHIFRLISNLRRRNIEIAQLLSSGVAPLLENTPGWFELDRETFVLQIEHRKIELQQSRRIG